MNMDNGTLETAHFQNSNHFKVLPYCRDAA